VIGWSRSIRLNFSQSKDTVQRQFLLADRRGKEMQLDSTVKEFAHMA
jgi:hypothetical protein